MFAGGPANGGGGAAGVTYFGGPQVEVWAYSDTPGNNTYIYKHELLHALGLNHSTAIFGNNTNPIPNDEAVGTTLFGDWIPGFQNNYQLFDIAALQYLYGPPPGQRAGNDTYTLNPGVFDPLSPEIQWPLLWDGGGVDTLDYSAFAVSVNISLTPGELSRIGGATGGILDAGVFSINYRTVIEAAIGGSNNDQLSGNSAVNTLTGGAGDDTLDGRGGADTMNGQAGNDIYIVDNAADRTLEAANAGTDIVRTTVSYALGAGVSIETLQVFNPAGTTAINLTGNEIVNTLNGGAGTNILDGKGGADIMRGFAGNDAYVVDNGADKALEAANAGTDIVRTTVSYALRTGMSLETLQVFNPASTAAINLVGNEIANALNGSAGANALDGRGGSDTMRGFASNDLYTVDNAADRVLEAANAGTDTVRTSVSYALGTSMSVEKLQTTNAAATAAINLTGNEFANTIVGNAGSNVIAGKAGNDVLTGAGGNDFFLFNSALNAVSNVDTITDFNRVADTVRLESDIFKALGATAGTLASGKFFIGAHAHDADDRIVYNSVTGALLYDSNGSAAGQEVRFATLTKNLTLTNADFVIV